MVKEDISRILDGVSGKRLWFGFAGAAAAWAIAGILDVTWEGRGCPRSETALILSMPGWAQALTAGITFFLLAVAILAGVVSYRNWRKLASEPDFVEAEANDRREFMGMFGVLVSTTLAIGIIWFVLAIFIVGVCVRAH
ncbi:MAG TPA: hypothetical protein VFZ27_12255 [Terriglobia bacterium]|nr:hypothetical protein [Terriglobia bacterium]